MVFCALYSVWHKLTGGLQRQWANKPLNTFTEALEAFRTAMSFRFFDWLTKNMDVFASHKESFGYIWAEKLCKSHSSTGDSNQVVLGQAANLPFCIWGLLNYRYNTKSGYDAYTFSKSSTTMHTCCLLPLACMSCPPNQLPI